MVVDGSGRRLRSPQHRFALPGLSRTAHRFYIERLANHVPEIIMPTLILKIASSQIAANHASLAEALTEVTVNELGKRREVTAVLMEEIPAAHWFIGAQAAAQPTAWLEISITAGTNSAQQKEAFMDAAWRALDRRLGAGVGLHPASYVIVRELPAQDWGYGGLTQKARLARRNDLRQVQAK